MSETKTEREPKPLSPEYHKARKQLLLWAGILFVWEWVGIDLEKAESVGGNVGAIVAAIKSPQAVPWVLLILVAYFLFKMWIEWLQCELSRRHVVAARLDFISACIITALAYILYAYQSISRIQLADLIERSPRIKALGFTSVVIFTLTFSLLSIRRVEGKVRPGPPFWGVVAAGMMFLVLFASRAYQGIYDWRVVPLGFTVGALLGFYLYKGIMKVIEHPD